MRQRLVPTRSDFDSKVSVENETAKQLKSFESELEYKKTELDVVLSENNILKCPDFNLLTEDSIKELKREAETFTDSLKKSRATVEACEKSVEGKQREDVLKINKLIDSYTSEKEKWDNLYTAGDRSLHNNQNIYNSVEKLKNDFEEKLRIADVYENLKKTANGEIVSDNSKITFERYIMGSYFEQVLYYANMRFSKMTGGRYAQDLNSAFVIILTTRKGIFHLFRAENLFRRHLRLHSDFPTLFSRETAESDLIQSLLTRDLVHLTTTALPLQLKR